MDTNVANSANVSFEEMFNDDQYYGYYDWFCEDAELKDRAAALKKKVDALCKSKRFDPAECTYFFQNMCPAVGDLYDAIKICNADGDVIFCIKIGNQNDDCRFAVYGIENDFEFPLYQSNKWGIVRRWFEMT